MSTDAIDTRELDDFFHRYAHALAGGDLPGISGCYAYPSYVAGDDDSVVITAPEQIETFFAGAAEGHHAAGITRAVPELQQVVSLSDALTEVDVRWSYTDDAGTEQAEDRFRYLVRRRPTIAICVVTAVSYLAYGEPAPNAWA